ncbi:MAG: efflux transporter periplasmic adaptor subunit [Hydrogenophilales bacterium 17-61-76]|nr:MAG: efflux transporter periplasmic adaptor subunit [Hydrogenophilales bacterium 17-61-76]
MKKTPPRIPLSAWAVATLCVLTSTAQAADQSVRFAVPNSQVQALGIRTVPLQSQAGAVKASFPAQVVVPPTAEQVVSSPVAGLVAQLLVQQNQIVRSGTPLVRMATLNQARAALRLSGMSAATIARIAASGKPQDSMTLAATQAGIVTVIAVKPGQRVEAATALLHVAQIDSLWLDIQIPVSEGANWPVGTKVKVQGRDVRARILSTSPTVSSGSQTVVLRAAVEGKTGLVRPGEFLTVELPIVTTQAAAQGSWDVPLSAVAHDGKQANVFVRTPAGFEARPVKVTASAGQRVRVQGPLKAGEQIAVSGVVALKGAWLEAKESQ